MEMKIYTQRLIKFGKHLLELEYHPEEGLYETVTIVEIAANEYYPFDMTYPAWVFDQLLLVFDEWDFDEITGEPILKAPATSWGTFYDICEFFNLSLDEISIFDLEGNQKLELFGGKVLNFESTTKDVAFNIIELAKSRMLNYENNEQ